MKKLMYIKQKLHDIFVLGSFAIMVLFVLPQSAFSQFASQKKVIVRDIEIKNVGPGQLDRSYVETHLSQKAGAELDYSLVSSDVRDILKTGLISDADVEAVELPDGVKLIYKLKKRLQLDRPITFSGAEHFREKKLRGFMGLEVGDYIDDQVIGEKVRKIIKEYNEDKYPDVSVTWKIIETSHSRGLGKVHIIINENIGKAKIKKLEFIGNEHISKEDLKKVIGIKRIWNPFGWFGQKYNKEQIDIAREKIRTYYIGQGYLDVQVAEPEVKMYKKGKYKIIFKIKEGRRYYFSKNIKIETIGKFSPEQIRHRVLCYEGAPVTAASLQGSVQGIKDFYGSKGYIDTYVDPILIPDLTNATVSVDFKVKQGFLTHIRNIKIRGNTRTRDKVIRRELLVYPGELYNTVKIDRSKRIIKNLGYFSSVNTYPEKTLKPDEKDLVIEVAEKRTGQFMMGAGFSSVDKLMGFVEISQGNFDIKGWPYFTGGGQKLKLRLQFGTRRSRYDLSFTEPWFLNRRLSLGIDLFRSDVDYDDYSLKRTGSAIKLGKALPGPNRIDFKYQIVKKEEYDIADTNTYYYLDNPTEEYHFATDENYIKSSFRTAVTHDTRNNPFMPSRGNRSSVYGEIAGGPFGFDLDVYKLGIKGRQYFPLWFGHVLSLKGQVEVIDEYGGTDEMPISERLFLGGGRTLRGFDYRDVGPKVIRKIPTDNGDYVEHRAVGGRTMVMASAEYTIPIISHVRFAGFYDIGNVWRDAYDFDFSSMASSVGIGLRIDMPGFPIRIDRAWVVSYDDEYTRDDPWVFWIGYDY